MFSFHTKEWWKNLWEKTGLVDITSSYNIPYAKEIWYSYGKWARENFDISEFQDLQIEAPEFDDVDYLDADIENQLTLFVMTALKK
jgi:hypothetical protein